MITKKTIRLEHLDTSSLEETLGRILQRLPSDRLARLLDIEVLGKLTPEQRLAGLSVEQILQSVSPEVREVLRHKLGY